VHDNSVGKTSGTVRFISFIVIVVISIFVGVSGYRSIMLVSKNTIVIAISIVLALATLIFFLVKPLKKFWPYSFALLAVSIAYLLNFLIGDISSIWFKVDKGTPLGLAVAKITDAIPLIVIIFLFNWISRKGITSLYLKGGKLKQSLLIGLLIGIITFLPFAFMGGLKSVLGLSSSKLLTMIPWLLLFSCANGFMEELWFRGLWMGRSVNLIGRGFSLIGTIIIFTAFHVLIYTNQQSLLSLIPLIFQWGVLGALCGWVTLKTNNLWGAVLGHAAGDFFLYLGIFAAAV
jgi:membrane protease YdiL (CAAX protease family)